MRHYIGPFMVSFVHVGLHGCICIYIHVCMYAPLFVYMYVDMFVYITLKVNNEANPKAHIIHHLLSS